MSYYYGNITEETLENMTSREIVNLMNSTIEERLADVRAKEDEEKEYRKATDSMMDSCLLKVKDALLAADVDIDNLRITGSTFYIPEISIKDEDNKYFKYSIDVRYKDGSPQISSSSWSNADLTTPESIIQLQKTVNILNVIQYDIDWSMLDINNFPKYADYIKVGFIPQVDTSLFNKAYINAKKREDLKDDIALVIDGLENIIGEDAVVRDKENVAYYKILDETPTHYLVKKAEKYDSINDINKELKKATIRRVRKDLFAKRVMGEYDRIPMVMIISDPDNWDKEYDVRTYNIIQLPKHDYNTMSILAA